MKAKLIHRGNGDYKLYVNGATYAQSAPNPHRKLSKQNCDEIFGILNAESEFYKVVPYTLSPETEHKVKGGFIMGFNKAMELNKDKLFTVEDMQKLMYTTIDFLEQDEGVPLKFFKEFIQSLQQPTEIEVEIVTESLQVMVQHGDMEFQDFPKLDKDGCLILKKI
jgi:hypothetical protein